VLKIHSFGNRQAGTDAIEFPARDLEALQEHLFAFRPGVTNSSLPTIRSVKPDWKPSVILGLGEPTADLFQDGRLVRIEVA
jgi:hypothetical protein